MTDTFPEEVQYPDPANYKTFKLKHKHYADRWVTPYGGIRPWGLSDNTVLVFYDEDDLFGRIGFDMVLNPHEASYANQATNLTGNEDSVGTSFILKLSATFSKVKGCLY